MDQNDIISFTLLKEGLVLVQTVGNCCRPDKIGSRTVSTEHFRRDDGLDQNGGVVEVRSGLMNVFYSYTCISWSFKIIKIVTALLERKWRAIEDCAYVYKTEKIQWFLVYSQNCAIYTTI